MNEELLSHHGDSDALPGLVDLAVNIRPGMPPKWLRREIAAADLARYPNQNEALAAIAARHGRSVDEVLLTAGAAEAFVLIARGIEAHEAAVVHPQFTEPEVCLRVAGRPVTRVILEPPFTLAGAVVPETADLVVIGNPTNPTSVLHPAETIRALRRPARLVVVDEAFADCIPGESESLAADPDLDGFIVVRSLTKTWGLAGLRIGYVLADAETIGRLHAVQPAWPVSAPALAACVATATPRALADAHNWSVALADTRAALVAVLSLLDVEVVPDNRASFVLINTKRRGIRESLHQHGFAVRRGESFPGLDESWIRVAVREPEVNERFVTALVQCLEDLPEDS